MKTYDVAAYVWPAYTGDEERSRMFWPEGIGEWQSVKNAVKKNPDHSWPRKPIWGYVNEADSRVMEMEINVAAEYGVNVFIYDWYWYDGRPFLEKCLNDGFLKAKNREKMKFYLMWANHDVNHVWDIRLSGEKEDIIWRGAVNRDEFEKIGRRIIEKYFTQSNYYQIDGKPVFMIYDIENLIKGLGGETKTGEAIAWFREEVKRFGFRDLHLQLVIYGNTLNLSGMDKNAGNGASDIAERLGFDSITHYQFVHFTDINRDYREILKDVKEEWNKIDEKTTIPYFPHISIGWDNNPRFNGFREGIVKKNTPESFAEGLHMAKEYLMRHPGQQQLVTINSWNEWTETSYLEPDDRNGYGYLEAVKRIFNEQ